MKTRVEAFEFLMEVLDHWKVGTGEREKDSGAFTFLREGSYVRDIVISPNYRFAMPGLKTFLATDVLEIYQNRTKSKVSYTNIASYLSGEKVKKYNFNFEVLDQCFQIADNKRAFQEKAIVLEGYESLKEDIEKYNEWIPYLLLEKIRDTAWRKLRRYYSLCDKECCEDCEKKKLAYFQFAQAVALFEIFYVECVLEPAKEYAEDCIQTMRSMELEILQMKERIKSEELDIEKLGMFNNLLNQLLEEQLEALQEKLDRANTYKLLETELAVDMCAFLHILLILEAVNTSDSFGYGTEYKGSQLRDALYDEIDKNFNPFFEQNKNRKRLCRIVNEHLEKLLSQYTIQNYDVAKLMVQFLEELNKSKREQDIKRLRDLQFGLAAPVYRELGGLQ